MENHQLERPCLGRQSSPLTRWYGLLYDFGLFPNQSGAAIEYSSQTALHPLSPGHSRTSEGPLDEQSKDGFGCAWRCPRIGDVNGGLFGIFSMACHAMKFDQGALPIHPLNSGISKGTTWRRMSVPSTCRHTKLDVCVNCSRS